MNRFYLFYLFILFFSCTKIQQKKDTIFCEEKVDKNSTIQKKSYSNLSLFYLCKVWGFMKYHSPELQNHKNTWDEMLLQQIPIFEHCNSDEEIKQCFDNLTKKITLVKSNSDYKDSCFTLIDNNWLNEKKYFSPINMTLFNKLKYEHRLSYCYFANYNEDILNTDFSNDSKFFDDAYLTKDKALLGLFRFWNMINYFYPSKKGMRSDWDEVLINLIPIFQQVTNTADYHKACQKLFASVEDSHMFFSYKPCFGDYGNFRPNSKFAYTTNGIIVLGSIDSTLTPSNLLPNDKILAINDVLIAAKIDSISKVVEASNDNIRKYNAIRTAFFTNKNDTYTVLRNQKIEKINVNCISQNAFFEGEDKLKSKYKNVPTCKKLNEEITYLHCNYLFPENLNVNYEIFKNSKYLIFDMRGYPNGIYYDFCNLFLNEKVPFAKFTYSDPTLPGLLRINPITMHCGQANNNVSKTKLVVLINEETISQAEFTCMALKTIPNVVFIGRPTAAADGNVSKISLPCGVYTFISGLGVYYPDMQPTQRIGIIPDIFVEIQGGKIDEILEKAIKYLQYGK